MESLIVPADLDALATISVFITDATSRAGLDDHAAWQVQLAVDEASTNIIQHGYSDESPGEIELAWQVVGPDLLVTLRDRGRRFNPHNVPAPDISSPLEERQAGGLGLYLMGRLMDSVEFEFDDAQGNLLKMTKRIGSTGAPAQIFDLAGRLDAVSSQAAIARVYAAISAGARHVLLDMSQVTFLSSSGLRALLLVRKELLAQSGELRLCALKPQVSEVFTLTGFTQVFAIHSTREEALRAFGRETRVNRERWLTLYCIAVGALGWIWLLLSGPLNAPWPVLLLFLFLALLVEGAGFRVPPSDPHSLVGIVLLTSALALGASNGALVAALSGAIFGVLLPLIYGRARTFYLMAARPFLRSGVRAIGVLLGATLAMALFPSDAGDLGRLTTIVLCYALVIQLNRVVREYFQGGRTGVVTWFRASWRPALGAEIVPLPLAVLGAAIYTTLGTTYFVIGAAGLLAASLAVRRSALNVQRQRRSVRELAQLNEVSRAIIRAELSVEALCELIYREASKVVDTSSFHLGLFEPSGDRYTLVVRVQDRVRLPPLIVELPSGDGIVGWMRETGRALLVEDFATEMDQLPARPRYQSERPPRAGIYVPLIAGDTVIGSISIQSYRPRAFDSDDMRLLSLIADQAAVAISKARAFNEASQRAIQLQAIHQVSERITAILDLDELLPSVVRLIQEHFGYQPVHIFTLEDDGTLSFRASTARGDALARLRQIAIRQGNGIVGAAAESAQPVLVNDVRHDPRYIGDDWHTLAELAVPLRFGDRNIGVLDVQSAEANRFSESDLFVMRTLADQIAVAIESARAFTAQREEAWTLNSLLQVAENIARASSLDDLLPGIVRLPPLLLGCDRCYVLVWGRERGTFTPLAAYGLTPEQRAAFIGRPFDEAKAPLLAEARRTMTPIAVGDAQSRQYMCPPILEPFGGGALLALPLTARGAALGMLVADYAPPGHTLAAREMTLYAGMANQIAGALESALLAQEAADAVRLDEELRVARDIQTALLPASPPQLAGWQLAADWRSARLVGGDFYDFWRLPRPAGEAGLGMGDSERKPHPPSPTPQPLGFVVADVSDKGVPAAMFMTLSRSLMRAAALDGSSPSVALGRANRWITRDSESAMFVTLFYGILQPDTGDLLFGCAGHNPPLLFRTTGEVLELTTPGIALGVLEDVVLGEDRVTLEVGDILVCYTDGLTEAINGAEEAFGVPRLVDAVSANREHSAEELVAVINGALLRFTERPPFDDLTLVVIKRVGETME